MNLGSFSPTKESDNKEARRYIQYGWTRKKFFRAHWLRSGHVCTWPGPTLYPHGEKSVGRNFQENWSRTYLVDSDTEGDSGPKGERVNWVALWGKWSIRFETEFSCEHQSSAFHGWASQNEILGAEENGILLFFYLILGEWLFFYDLVELSWNRRITLNSKGDSVTEMLILSV